MINTNEWPGARIQWTEDDRQRGLWLELTGDELCLIYIKIGFVTRGLWAYSRHPNCACEQAFWVNIVIRDLYPHDLIGVPVYHDPFPYPCTITHHQGYYHGAFLAVPSRHIDSRIVYFVYDIHGIRLSSKVSRVCRLPVSRWHVLAPEYFP